MFHDIQMKGVTRNYNTKPSEKMNGPLKKFYRNHTNFKDVALLQILLIHLQASDRYFLNNTILVSAPIACRFLSQLLLVTLSFETAISTKIFSRRCHEYLSIIPARGFRIRAFEDRVMLP